MDKKELIKDNIIHDFDFEMIVDSLKKFYGYVEAWHNDKILEVVSGERILEVGAGLGRLSKLIHERKNIATVPIDIDDDMINTAKKEYGIAVYKKSIYDITESDFGKFDTVIFRESISHLDFPKVLEVLKNIVDHNIIIFESNINFVTQVGRILSKKPEHYQLDVDEYITLLEKNGFRINSLEYFDVMSFALSGGFVTRQFIPDIKWMYKIGLAKDKLFSKFFNAVGLGKIFCTRYLLVGEKM